MDDFPKIEVPAHYDEEFIDELTVYGDLYVEVAMWVQKNMHLFAYETNPMEVVAQVMDVIKDWDIKRGKLKVPPL